MSPPLENDKTLTNKDLTATSPVVNRNMDSINPNMAQSQAKIGTSELPDEVGMLSMPSAKTSMAQIAKYQAYK